MEIPRGSETWLKKKTRLLSIARYLDCVLMCICSCARKIALKDVRALCLSSWSLPMWECTHTEAYFMNICFYIWYYFFSSQLVDDCSGFPVSTQSTLCLNIGKKLNKSSFITRVHKRCPFLCELAWAQEGVSDDSYYRTLLWITCTCSQCYAWYFVCIFPILKVLFI